MNNIASDYKSRIGKCLNTKEVELCLGEGSELLKRYNDGVFDTTVYCMNVSMVGREFNTAPKPIVEFINYICDSFSIPDEKRKYFFILDEDDFGTIIIGCGSESLLHVWKKTWEVSIVTGRYDFSGDGRVVAVKLLSALKFAGKFDVPLKYIGVYPMSVKFLSSSYMHTRNSCYIGFREAILRNGNNLDALWGCTSAPGEYVMGIVI